MSGSSSDIPGFPIQDKGKAPQKRNLQLNLDDFSPSKRPRIDERPKRNLPRPNPRISFLLLGPSEGEYYMRVLPPSEADPTFPALRISNDYEHFVFLDIPSFIDVRDMEYSARYRVFGEENREYETAFSRVCINGPMEVVHFTDWERIVRDHSLRVGDVVSFHRHLDTNISDNFFYILKYARKVPLDGGNKDADARKEAKDKQKVSEPSNANVDNTSAGKPSGFNIVYPRLVLNKIPEGSKQGPGSRDFPEAAFCLTKILDSDAVTVRTPKLNLSFEDAVILTDNPKTAGVRPDGKYLKVIDVFDGNDQRYRMTLYHHFYSWGEYYGFCLGGEWKKFVSSHNLQQGDQVIFYKILDSSICIGYYHVLRHVAMTPSDLARIMNDSVRAEGVPLEAGSNPTASDQRRNIPFLAVSQRRNIPFGAAGYQFTTTMSNHERLQRGNISLEAGNDLRRIVPLAAGSDDGRNIQLAAAGDGRRNIPLAAGSDQRRNIPLAADVDQRRNIQLAAAGDRRMRINFPERPGSRRLTTSEYCTTKTLEPRDVLEIEPRLHLDALSEAKYLYQDPAPGPYPLGKGPKSLLVYDRNDNPYVMLLSQYASPDGVITYTLGGNWQKFIRAHGLRADDKIAIYRVPDNGFLSGYYYVFIKNPV